MLKICFFFFVCNFFFAGMLSIKQCAVNIKFIVIDLTRLGIKPESTAPEKEAFITRPSELLNTKYETNIDKRRKNANYLGFIFLS